jgi:hypothetical protein
MANIASNPWSFGNSDVNTAALAAASSMVLNADGTITMTTNAAATFTVGQFITVYDVGTTAAFNGLYQVLVVTSPTVYQLDRMGTQLASGLTAGTGGTAAVCLYPWQVRIEDMSWQNPSAAGQLLEIRDSNGNIIWTATATGAGSQNRGKLFWVSGVTPTQCQSGTVIITVN